MINLLPKHERHLQQKKRLIQGITMLLFILCFFLVLVDYSVRRQSEIWRDKNELLRHEDEIYRKERMVLDSNIEKEQKMATMGQWVNSLKKRQALTRSLLDNLALLLPNEDAWFDQVEINGRTGYLSGYLKDESDIAVLIHNIQAHSYMKNPEVLHIKQEILPQSHRVANMYFHLRFTLDVLI